jgi:hypothetical protein
MGFTVVGNPAATVMTSSPFSRGLCFMLFSMEEPNELIATKLALDPLLTRIEGTFLPKYSDNLDSNSLENRPAVSHMSKEASTRKDKSSPSTTFADAGI